MKKLDYILEELVTANRILAREGIVDSFGHVSVRHPEKPDHFLMSRARAPDCVEKDDILEFTLQGVEIDPGERKPYVERFIHGSILEARPEIHSVVHNHSPSVIPFGVTKTTLKPLLHLAASIGFEVPLWDSRDQFGDTDILVSSVDMGRDLARRLSANPTALLRGHGSVTVGKTIRQAVHVAVYLETGAKLQMQAMQMGEINFLTRGEVDKIIARTGSYTINRGWENWCRRAGRPVQVEWEE